MLPCGNEPEKGSASYEEEEEKIFAGHVFCRLPERLLAIKHKAHTACQRFNAMDEYGPGRTEILAEILGSLGRHCRFQGPVQFNYGAHTFIGDNFFANFNLTVMDDARIFLEKT